MDYFRKKFDTTFIERKISFLISHKKKIPKSIPLSLFNFFPIINGNLDTKL